MMAPRPHDAEDTESNTRATPPVSWLPGPRPGRGLLRFPLFHKIMLANVGIVVAVAAAAVVLARGLETPSSNETFATIALFAFGGGILVVLVNGLLLRLALEPIEELQAAADRVRAGDLDLRVPVSPLADAGMERLVGTFNGMLDSIRDYQQKQRQVSRRELNAAEEERRRVAAELHDKTAQTLAGLMVRLSLARGVKEPEVRESLLAEAAEQASVAMDEVYRIAQALRPPALEMLGLNGAVEAHARSVAQGSGVEIDVVADDLRGALDPQAEIALYRILQEALSNVVRHAEARHARIRLQRTMDGVLASIEDDGAGFAAEKVDSDADSLGLFGMRERAAQFGGQLEIRSGSRGTTIEVNIPVP